MDDHRELTAAYALDALDERERERYEAHLATCEECREELASFWAVSGALAHAAGGPAPPAALRERILQQARSERPNVVPLRRRFALTPAAGIAAVAAVAAVLALGLGLWGTSLSRELDDRKDELAVLGDPNAQVFETANGEANLVVTPTGEAALVVRRLAPAPKGKDYEIWVFENGVPRRAGLFERPGIAVLDRRVAPGQMVAVTVEPDGGLDAPTGAPIFTASTA
jgi:anti-sigma factor RsiW